MLYFVTSNSLKTITKLKDLKDYDKWDLEHKLFIRVCNFKAINQWLENFANELDKQNAINNLYEIEKVIVTDCLKYYNNSIYDYEILTTEKSNEILENFANWYLSIINSVFKDTKSTKCIFCEDLIIIPFYKGEKLPLINLENPKLYLDTILLSLNLNFTISDIQNGRINGLVVWDKNTNYVINKNFLGNWIASKAIKLADTTFAKLRYNGF